MMSFEDSLKEFKLAHLQIQLKDLVIATNNFDEENLIKRGRSADVYKGLLLQSYVSPNVVIWRFHPLSPTQEMYFLVEIHRLSRFKHINIASFVGFCQDEGERMVVMEHVANGSLDEYLGDPTLTWSQRLKICLGATLGFTYFADPYAVYGIKSSKILLDKDWEAKVCCIRISLHKSDFITCPRDEYSLGWIMFEVLSGRKATTEDVIRFAYKTLSQQELDDMIAPYLRKQIHTQSLSRFLDIARKCLNWSMGADKSEIVGELQKALDLQLKHENHVKQLVNNLACLKIPLSDIKLATDDFADRYHIKSHRDDKAYKAELDHKGEGKKAVVIKRMVNGHNYWKTTDFFAELEMLATWKHHNLVSLLGFCNEDSEMILVFESSCKETLDDYLGNLSNRTNLTWEQRIRICLDIAHGLNYLHDIEGKQNQGMIHQGILSANVTLDEKLTAKITNFRVSKFDSCLSLWLSRLENFRSWFWEANDSRLIQSSCERLQNFINWLSKPNGSPWILSSSKRLKTLGPNWFGKHTSKPWDWIQKDDIYSIGVILFEILTGRLSYDRFYMTDNNFNGFASMVRQHFNEGTLENIIDSRIREEAQACSYTVRKGPNQYSLDAYSKIAYECLAETPNERPTLEAVIKSLEKALHFQVQNFEHMKIPLKDIVLATNNFGQTCLIGSGTYGEVYKAKLKTKSKYQRGETLSTVAIKRIISREDNQGKEGFLVELDVLTRCEHPNIVTLLGFCVEGSERILVFEHVSKGSLDDYLESNNVMSKVDWAQRLKIGIDIAKGLEYLHTTMEDKSRIIHRDIKSANILLGENLEAKIADFGLSKVHHGNKAKSTISTNTVAGTEFYLDLEYRRTGNLKKATDIYSLGVVLFEIFSGKHAYDSCFFTKYEKGIAPVARLHFEKGTIKEMLDPNLVKQAYELGFIRKVGPDHDSLDAFSTIAFKCLAETQGDRPTIDVVIKELEKALYIQENVKSFKMSLEDIKLGVEHFSDANCIMRGGYWMMYKVKVQHYNRRKEVAVKRFSRSTQKDGFLKEFEVLYKYQHENIIGLIGYCKENFEKIIVYDHASMRSLDRCLKDTSFSWITRLKICIDIGNGLKFIHGGDGGQDVVIHRDLKSSNILLTEDWKAKICGFELALTYPANKKIEYHKNDVVGSPGYCDPMYSVTHYLTKESDIYSFGVILFEILCGRLALDITNRGQFLDTLVKDMFQEARLDEIVFEGIKEQIAPKSLITFRRIAIQCLLDQGEERPTAGDVVVYLQKALEFQVIYETRKAKLHSTYQEILDQNSKSVECYSTTWNKDIYNILSKAILEDDKLEGYEMREAELHRNHKEILESSKSPKINSTMAKTYIKDIISNGILLEDDRQEIIRFLQQPTQEL